MPIRRRRNCCFTWLQCSDARAVHRSLEPQTLCGTFLVSNLAPPPLLRRMSTSMRALATFATIGMLLGCQSRPAIRPLSSEVPRVPEVLGMAHVCKAAGGRVALGAFVDHAMLDEARLRAGASDAATVWPGDPPLAYESERLLIDVDESGRGRVARCG
jgi:hypothetical protein